MLMEKDGTGKGRTLFKCDRCNKKVSRENRKGIYIQERSFSPKKAYDLCNRCYAALKRGVENGKK